MVCNFQQVPASEWRQPPPLCEASLHGCHGAEGSTSSLAVVCTAGKADFLRVQKLMFAVDAIGRQMMCSCNKKWNSETESRQELLGSECGRVHALIGLANAGRHTIAVHLMMMMMMMMMISLSVEFFSTHLKTTMAMTMTGILVHELMHLWDACE
jgi:hypothetical protein